MDPVGDQLHSALAARKADALRYAEAEAKSAADFFSALSKDLQGLLPGSGIDAAASGKRLSAANGVIRGAAPRLDKAYAKAEKNLASSLSDYAWEEARWGKRALGKAFKGAAKGLQKNVAEELASKTLIQGSPAKAWWAGQSAAARLRFASAIRMGAISGQSLGEIAKQVQLTIGVSAREAMALARTAISAVGNAALFFTFLENEELLKGVLWSSVLDRRTTILCAGRDGAAWGFDGLPLPHSHLQSNFPGAPPAHFNCRSMLAPILLSAHEKAYAAHGDKIEVGPAEAEVRLQALAGTSPAKGQAAAPGPVQPLAKPKGFSAAAAAAAKRVAAIPISPYEIYFSEGKLDYAKVRAALSAARTGIIAARSNGKLVAVAGQERLAAAVLRNEGAVPLKIIEMPAKGRESGPAGKLPKLPLPSHGKGGGIPAGLPARLDYGQWLAAQSPAKQADILGPARAKLFAAGRLPLSALSDVSGKPLTLAELEKRGRVI